MDSPEYAADVIGDFMKEQEDYPEQIKVQRQIDQLIYALTSFKIGHEDDEEWVPQEDTEEITMVKLKEEKRQPKPIQPIIVKPAFGTPDNETIKGTIKEIIKMAKEL